MTKDDIIGAVSKVLIETSWNVKKFDKKYFHQNTLVLIETSWNVKLLEAKLIDQICCINRNIVECKADVE